MSSYIDINQLLEEIGASDRSADDPWTLGSNRRGTVRSEANSPAVTGDLGASLQDLTSGIQSSQRITYADTIASSPTGGSGTGNSSASGGGLLGGLLNFFPLASGIAKLFGFGGSSSPPALTPYQLPPSINFAGAMSSPTSGVTSLSYGADGLPRTSGTLQTPATVSSTAPNSSFSDTNVLGQLSSLVQPTFSAVSATPPYGTTESSISNVATQLGTLANSTFATEPSASNPMLNSDLISNPNRVTSGDTSFPTPSQSSAGSASNGSGVDSSGAQQGQSILVQVQAMDSQSFMDHSQDIAQAVRQAMLNLHSVNDVILDL
jgi:hypothetical protein